jgi:GNAT superfamily N-acetyltransferase
VHVGQVSCNQKSYNDGMETLLRRATIEDLAKIQSLNQSLFQFEHDSGFYQGDSYNLNWPYEAAGTNYFTNSLSDNPTDIVFVAEVKRDIIGYLAGAFTSRAYRTANPIAEIENMFVEQAHRHHGIGKALVYAFMEWCRVNKVASVRVGAFASNHKAVAFYRSCGFNESELYLEAPIV